MSNIVEINDVSAGYSDDVILQDINLKIADKDFLGVIGPNGGGKTTLVKVILGLIKPMKGEVITHPKNKLQDKHFIGYLPQVIRTDQKFPISVQDVVLSGLAEKNRLIKKYSKNDKAEVTNMLERMGIGNLAKKNIGELSGGQLQRVFLSRAIVGNPQLLILDEPSTYVDNKFEHDLYNILQELNEKMAIMMVSHDLGTISYHVKTIACVNRHLHYHKSNQISQEQLEAYNCPIQIIAHGHIPHTILKEHHH